MKTEKELKQEIDKYHKSGKEDIEIYYDDDFANIQRFKGRIAHYKKEAKLEGIQQGKQLLADKLLKKIKELWNDTSFTRQDILDELEQEISKLLGEKNE